MIVDDELYARIRLKKEFSLEEEGFTVDQEAANGQEALELMGTQRPDILLTDMRMPVMDGLALIAEVKKRWPAMPVVALSGYDDYEYVRSSLKMGAVDYLLKHRLERDTVLFVLQKCADEIRALSQREQAERQAVEDQRDSWKVRKREAFMKLLMGNCQNASNLTKPCMLADSRAWYQVLLMKVSHWRQLEIQNGRIAMVMMDETVMSIAQEIIDQMARGTVEPIGDGEYVILFSLDSMYSRQYVREMTQRMAENLRQNITKYINVTVSFAMGRTAGRPEEIASSYRRAQESLSLSYLSGNWGIIQETDAASQPTSFVTLSNEHCAQVTSTVLENDPVECRRLLEELFAELVRQRASRASCQVVCIELINLIVRNVAAMPLGSEVAANCQEDKSHVMAADNAQEGFDIVRESYDRLFSHLNETRGMSEFHSHTLRAIEYIRQHPTDELSLSSIAEQLNLNKSYLSRIFSQDCGQSLTEYVTAFRVEEAKKGLAEGLSIKESAKRAGFSNLPYFFRLFKQYAGQTPQDYQRAMSKSYIQGKKI